MNYFDTSALIKRFVEERGSDAVAALLAAEPMAATSVVAYAEVHAGLARKLRERALTTAGHRRTARAFDADWRAFLRVGVTEPVLALVPGLVRRHPLRGFDAIHLAAAVRLQRELAEAVHFVAADDRLLAAAEGERLKALDVSS
ncbi:MAG: type II toxin-antitoxin system VapC family toxin [Deltaproteobacteria bacterium]|nr:type II toxin-antitoxin system VapC family toxin [Deltaproteobacteria bacterium]